MAAKAKAKNEDGETNAIASMYATALEEVEKKYRLSGSSGAHVERFSSGCLVLDLLMGGGYYPGRWYTHLGLEASGKSTALLSTLAHSLEVPVPFRLLWDYEGCGTADTEIGYGKGKTARIDELFDLSEVESWKPGTWPGQERQDIDTVSTTGMGLVCRKGSLFYRGKKPTTKVTLSSGHSMTGFGHKFFVLTDGKATVVRMEDLLVGSRVLVRKATEEIQEEWRPVLGFGKTISTRYQVSNLGAVRSVDHWISFNKVSKLGTIFTEDRLVKGRVLRGNVMKDGHLWVALCNGHTQRKVLVHRIVARAFLGKAPAGKPLVLHWNDAPSDNRVSNLRYGSSIDNATDKKARGRVVAAKSYLTESQARDLYALKGSSAEKAAQKFGVPRKVVLNLWAHSTWKGLHEEQVPFDPSVLPEDGFEVAYVSSVELTGKKDHVFDVSLSDTEKDVLPHSILTNGIVTHNSMDWGYFQQMLPKPRTQVEMFGLKNDAGKRVSRGLVAYYDEDVAETFFDSTSSLLRKLPRKMWVPERKAWYLIFDNKPDNAAFRESADRKLSDSQYLYVPAPDGLPQALIFLDSYPAMLPENLDEDDKKSGMAAQARMFSEKLKLVKPKLRRRHCSIVGVNGIRLRPGVSFGSPEYEPCGEALKFVSDCRVRFNAVGVPKHCVGTGPVAEERSVDGEGTDRYRYSTLKGRKNKMGPNFMEGDMRIWMADSNGKGHGIDKVYDTWRFLKLTGWITGSMKKFELTVPNSDKTLKMEWTQLKELLLLKGDALKDVHKSLKLKAPLNLRRECLKILRSGEAVSHYFETARGGGDE